MITTRIMWIVFDLIILCLISHTALSAVLGIDYGSDSIKIAAVQAGKSFEIVLDEASKRAHPSLVVFDNDVRQYGTQATGLVSRRPQNSFLYFTRLLGKPHNTTMVEELKNDYVFNTVLKDDKRGTIRYVSPYYKESNADSGEESLDDVITAKSYSVEEITAMKFRHIKKIAQSYTDGEVSDCVITVPEFWSSKERQALKDAAQIAGLNVYGLINENSAAAVQYGLKRDYQTNKTEYMLFYNMGSTKTSVSIVKYSAYEVKERASKKRTVGCVEVMSQAWDETLGGNAFNRIVSKLIIERTKELLRKQTSPKVDESVIDNLENNARFTARVRTAANKAKKILSANTETFVSIEGVYEDIDLRTTISREELYEQSEPLFERATAPLNEAIESLNGKIEKTDIEGIVLLGGSSRIPRIKELLTEYLGKELRQDLNADEAPAFGAAFRAANLSSTFRVMGVNFEDITPFAVGVRLANLAEKGQEKTDDSFGKRGSLFSKGNNLYKRRAVTLKHAEDLDVSLYYEKYAPLPMDTSTDLGSFEITGITKAVAKYKQPDYNITDDADGMPKVSLSFFLDADGIVDLVQATATFTEWVTEEKKIPKIVPKKDSETENDDDTETEADNENDGSDDETGDKEDEISKDTDESNKKEDKTETDGDADDDNEDEEDEDDDDDVPEIEYETEIVHRKKTYKVDLDVKKILPQDVKPYDLDDFDTSDRMLMELDDRDRSVLATASARNALESYIFESRSKLNDDENVQKVSKEEERESLISTLTEAEDWIWDVEVETEAVFKSKMRELRKLGDPIFLRATELEIRPKTIEMARKAIKQLYQYIDVLKLNYSWVSVNDTGRLFNMTERVETWLNERVAAQEELTLYDEPAFESYDVQRRVTPVLEYANKLLSKPRPYDYYKKDRKAKNGTKNANGTSSANGTNGTEGSEDGAPDSASAGDEEDPFSVPIDVEEDGDDGDTSADSGQETEDAEEDDDTKGEL